MISAINFAGVYVMDPLQATIGQSGWLALWTSGRPQNLGTSSTGRVELSVLDVGDSAFFFNRLEDLDQLGLFS